MELTEEYKVVADNMKSLEASEAVALAKEESFEEIIRDLTQRLKDAETRASGVRNLALNWLRILRPMRRSSLPGWTSMLPSTASWRPLTTRCLDTKKRARLPSNLSFFGYSYSYCQVVIFFLNQFAFI